MSGVGYDRAAQPGRRRPDTTSCGTSSPTCASRLRDARPPDATAVGASRRHRRRGRRGNRLRARDPGRRADLPAADRRRAARSSPSSTRSARAAEGSPAVTHAGAVDPLHRSSSASATRSCRPGWAGSRPRGSSAPPSAAGGLGILASATMTYDQLAAAISDGSGSHRRAVRREPARRRRMSATGSPCWSANGRAAGVVRAGAEAGADQAAERRRRAGDAVDRRPAARREGRGVGRRRRDRAGRRRRRSHRIGAHLVAAPAGRRRGRTFPSSPPAGSSTDAAWSPRSPTARPASRWAPGSC